jgi:hypothetical protein
LISCLPDTLGILSWCVMRKWVDLLEGAFRQIAHTVASVRTVRWPCMLAGLLSQLKNTIHSPRLKPVSTDYNVWANSQQKTGPSHAPNPASNLITLSKLTCVT